VQFQSLLQISDILGAWYREPAFLDESGTPRPLSITGARSFETLTSRFLPQFGANEIADVFVAEGLLTRNTAGEVFPVRRTAAFAKPNPMMLDRMPVLAHGLFGTLAHNANAESRARGTFCDRGTTIDRFPVELIPAFNDFVKALAQALSNNVDAWGIPQQVTLADSAQRNVARVGVEIYTYAEPQLAPPNTRNLP